MWLFVCALTHVYIPIKMLVIYYCISGRPQHPLICQARRPRMLCRCLLLRVLAIIHSALVFWLAFAVPSFMRGNGSSDVGCSKQRDILKYRMQLSEQCFSVKHLPYLSVCAYIWDFSCAFILNYPRPPFQLCLPLRLHIFRKEKTWFIFTNMRTVHILLGISLLGSAAVLPTRSTESRLSLTLAPALTPPPTPVTWPSTMTVHCDSMFCSEGIQYCFYVAPVQSVHANKHSPDTTTAAIGPCRLTDEPGAQTGAQHSHSPPITSTSASASTSTHCDAMWCSSGTQWCAFWAGIGITGFDISRGVLPGEAVTQLGICSNSSNPCC
jgi:hypothetical protein